MKMSSYHQRVYKQGIDWVSGTARHNLIDDECCPDFSCCVPNLFVFDRMRRVDMFNKWARENGYKQIIDA